MCGSYPTWNIEPDKTVGAPIDDSKRWSTIWRNFCVISWPALIQLNSLHFTRRISVKVERKNCSANVFYGLQGLFYTVWLLRAAEMFNRFNTKLRKFRLKQPQSPRRHWSKPDTNWRFFHRGRNLLFEVVLTVTKIYSAVLQILFFRKML